MAATQSCWEADNTFGPRVSADCRDFDFTLLFEDAFFSLLPSTCFLLLLPVRSYFLHQSTIRTQSRRLTLYKQISLAVLLVLHVLLAAFSAQASALRTRALLPAAIINILATLAAWYGSFIEDRWSARPSDLLILYFSASTLCQLPRLRSVWLISSVGICRSLSVVTLVCTVAVLILESVSETRFPRSSHHHITKEQRGSFWSRTFFVHVLPFLRIGYHKALVVEDIPHVDAKAQAQHSGDCLRRAWHSTRTQSQYRMAKAVFRAYGLAFISAILPRLALSCFTFTQPFLITAAIEYIGGLEESQPRAYGPGLIGAYVLVYLGIAVARSVYWRQTYRFLTMMRAGLISMIYDKTLTLDAAGLDDSAAITLMGTDVERIVANLKNVHEAWASIIEVGVAIWLLQRQLDIACFIPLVISLGSVIAMIPVSNRTGQAQKQWIERVQKRLAVTANMLGSIKAVQMLGMNDLLFALVSQLREVEVKTSARFRKLLIWQVTLSNVPVVFAPFATFTIYAVVSLVQSDTSLLSSQAFASIALIALMTGPLLLFCQAMPAISQAIACFKRIAAYCGPESSFPGEEAMSLPLIPEKPSSLLLSLRNAQVARVKDKACPTGLNINISCGITMILGPVGCGKSTLLEAVVHETKLKSGSRIASFSKAAYCPQSPWMWNDTIRNNIIGAQEFDATWYAFACMACGLENDLETLADGDMHMAGSHGIALSGGQKQRIALARAVYSRLNVVVLDDIFSGIDSTTIAHICQSLLGPNGHFRRAGISVILATSQYELLRLADEIVIMDNYQITTSGSYDEVVSNNPVLTVTNGNQDGRSSLVTTVQKSTALQPTIHDQKNLEHSDAEDQSSQHKSPTDSIQQAQRQWPVYKYYIRSAGHRLVIAFLTLTFVESFCNSFSTLWISWWVRANEAHPNQRLGLYLGIYGMIFGLTFVAMIAGCWLLFVRGLNNTSLRLHSDILKTTLRAPITYFQRFDTGTITNRFSQDLELIDMMLPIYAVNCVTNVMEVCINIIIICIVGKYVAVTVPFLATVLFLLQSYYLRTSRQVRLLDIEAKAPLYSHFLETIRGISSIRAFAWELAQRKKAHTLLDRSQRPVYMMYTLQQWLTLVLDLIVGGIAVVLIAIITSLREHFEAESIGVALTLVLSLNQAMANAIRMWTMTEVSIGAVTRVLRFTQDTPSEEPEDNAPCMMSNEANSAKKLHLEWPEKGAIEITDLKAGYDSSNTPTLRNLNLSIKPGEKIAVCGPSGSGKTSLIMAMLHMLGIHSGRMAFDGVDITLIPRDILRSRISVVPQDPFFIDGFTMRFNLNPRGEISPENDESIISALEKVCLWQKINDKGALEMEFTKTEWSAGQMQLLSLARALVRKRQILILDEVASGVDSETEKLMQELIEKEFAQQTVISVVHRFRYIHWFDRVLVLKQGRLAEFDSPHDLLAKGEASEFWRLYEASRGAGKGQNIRNSCPEN